MQIGSSINSPTRLKAVRPQSAQQIPEHAASVAGQDSFQADQQTMASQLDRLGDVELRKMAGVKKPGFFRRMFNLAGQWVQGINLALSILAKKRFASVRSVYRRSALRRSASLRSALTKMLF